MIALAWTYFPPTCWMTSAYWFSAPTATILPSEPSASEDAQPPASRLTARTAARLAASGLTAALPFQPPRMTRLPLSPAGSLVTGNDNDSQFRSQHKRSECGEPRVSGHSAGVQAFRGRPERSLRSQMSRASQPSRTWPVSRGPQPSRCDNATVTTVATPHCDGCGEGAQPVHGGGWGIRDGCVN